MNAESDATCDACVPEALHSVFASPCCALLRNFDYVDNIRRGGDIDVLAVPFEEGCAHLLRACGVPLMQVKSTSMTSFLYAWGQIDMCAWFHWRGARHLDVADMARTTICCDGLYRVSPTYEALVAWLNPIIVGRFFKERYRELIVSVAREHPGDMERALAYAFGGRQARLLLEAAQQGKPEQASPALLRWLCWTRAFRRQPFRTFADCCRSWLDGGRRRLVPIVPWIAVLGPDGSGKSALIEELKRTVRGPHGRSPRVVDFHWRPGLVMRPRSASTDIREDSLAPLRVAAGPMKLLKLLVDWWVGYPLSILPLRARGRLVVFERHYVDLLVASHTCRSRVLGWLARAVVHLVPKPTCWIILDAEPEVLQQRKPEAVAAELVWQRTGYHELAANLCNACLLDAARPLDAVVAEAGELLTQMMHSYTTRRSPELAAAVGRGFRDTPRD